MSKAMSLKLVVGCAMAVASLGVASADQLNPQPEPPGIHGHAMQGNEMMSGHAANPVTLPPGPCLQAPNTMMRKAGGDPHGTSGKGSTACASGQHVQPGTHSPHP